MYAFPVPTYTRGAGWPSSPLVLASPPWAAEVNPLGFLLTSHKTLATLSPHKKHLLFLPEKGFNSVPEMMNLSII